MSLEKKTLTVETANDQFRTLSEVELNKVTPVPVAVLDLAFAEGLKERDAVAARTQSTLMTTRTLFR